MTAPLVSIIICCYNRARFLPKTLESAFAQSYKPVEIIVFDDGSEDETAELMSNYSDKISYHYQPNQGIAVARSNACRLANGEYIAFLDDDDLIPAERINILMAALKKHPQAIFAVGDLEIIDNSGKLTGKRHLPANHFGTNDSILFEYGDEAVLWPHVPATPHTTLFRKSDGEKVGWFDHKYRHASEDKDFFAKLGCLGPVVYTPNVVSYYRYGGHSSLTNNNNLRTYYSQLLLFENHLNNTDPKRKEFRRRLEQRILQTSTNIIKNSDAPFGKDSNINKESLKRALSLLSIGNRLKFFWAARVKRPIKALISRK